MDRESKELLQKLNENLEKLRFDLQQNTAQAEDTRIAIKKLLPVIESLTKKI